MLYSGGHTLLLSPAVWIAATLTLLPFLAAAFFGERLAKYSRALPVWVRILCPAVLCVPYVLVAWSAGNFRWGWFALYASLPVAVAGLLLQAREIDPEQRGNWRDFLVLAALGLSVDLRWFEGAWPPHLAVFSKMLLLDAGIYGFLAMRRLDGEEAINPRIQKQHFAKDRKMRRPRAFKPAKIDRQPQRRQHQEIAPVATLLRVDFPRLQEQT